MAGMAAGAIIAEIVVPVVTSIIAASSQQSARGVQAGMAAYNMMQQRAQANAAKDAAQGYSQATDKAVAKEMLDRKISAAAPGTSEKLPGGGFVSSGGAPTLYGGTPASDLEAWKNAAAATPAAAAANPQNAAQIMGNAQRWTPEGNPAAQQIGGANPVNTNAQQIQGEGLYDTARIFGNVIKGLPEGARFTADTRGAGTLTYQVPSTEAPGVEGMTLEEVRGAIKPGESARVTDQGVNWSVSGPPVAAQQPSGQGTTRQGLGGGWTREFYPDGTFKDIPPPKGFGVETPDMTVVRDQNGRLVVVPRR